LVGIFDGEWTETTETTETTAIYDSGELNASEGADHGLLDAVQLDIGFVGAAPRAFSVCFVARCLFQFLRTGSVGE